MRETEERNRSKSEELTEREKERETDIHRETNREMSKRYGERKSDRGRVRRDRRILEQRRERSQPTLLCLPSQ